MMSAKKRLVSSASGGSTVGVTRDARLVLFDVISSLRCSLAYTSTAAWCLRARDEDISALFPHPERFLDETRQRSPHSSACVSFSTGCIDKGSHGNEKRPAIGPRKGLGVRASRGRPSPRPGFFPEALVSTAILWPHRPWGSVCQRPAREALGGDVPWSAMPGDACRSCQRQACLLELLPKCGEEGGHSVGVEERGKGANQPCRGPGDRMGGIASRGCTCEGRWPGLVVYRALIPPAHETTR
ncbi:hypothetical protein CMUS01_09963 [Colletotrichum musicola]|uniref:Uncharacterized protein n=1 Tax=Colletotrichum musicola TaxID=2175873 RepID=A0A8H6K590_9PEZI|nr:hypothetical protein CMUS01_09963 [Colletotrichum musicola]